MPLFASWNFTLGKGLLVVDPQDDVLLLVSVDSELSLATFCVLSKAEDCEDVNSEYVGPDVVVVIFIVVVVVVVVVVNFPFPDEVVELLLSSFSLNAPFPM